MKEHFVKFENRAKKLKVDDGDVHRIRKNVQTLSSNHSTMYAKLKGTDYDHSHTMTHIYTIIFDSYIIISNRLLC